MLQNNLFFTQIIKQSINYVFSSITHDCLPTFGQVFDPMLGEICQFGCEEAVEPILELIVIVEGNCTQIVGEREGGRGGNPMEQGPESRADMEESPSPVLEWPLSSCLQSVVGRCHAEESLHVANSGVFAVVVNNSIQQ
jgi:hypothetical protein